jgi:peptidoglycan/LPS O-acetylase OafA/YrhL
MVAYRWREFIKPAYALPLVAAMLFVLLFPDTDLLFVIICAALVPSLECDTGMVARVLGSGPIYSLGLWSYSIYILHVRFNPVRSSAQRLLQAIHLPLASQCAIGLSVSAVVACAALTYRYIELPSRIFLRDLFSLRGGRLLESEPAAP